MNASATQGLALLLVKVMGLTGWKRIESHDYFFFLLRFLSAICLPLQDYQCFEGQKLFHYKSTATFPSCNSFERSLLGACSLLPFAKHQRSGPGGSSGCRTFWRAQPARFTSPRKKQRDTGMCGQTQPCCQSHTTCVQGQLARAFGSCSPLNAQTRWPLNWCTTAKGHVKPFISEQKLANLTMIHSTHQND